MRNCSVDVVPEIKLRQVSLLASIGSHRLWAQPGSQQELLKLKGVGERHERQWQDLGHDHICLQLNKDHQHLSMHRWKDPPLALGG